MVYLHFRLPDPRITVLSFPSTRFPALCSCRLIWVTSGALRVCICRRAGSAPPSIWLWTARSAQPQRLQLVGPVPARSTASFRARRARTGVWNHSSLKPIVNEFINKPDVIFRYLDDFFCSCFLGASRVFYTKKVLCSNRGNHAGLCWTRQNTRYLLWNHNDFNIIWKNNSPMASFSPFPSCDTTNRGKTKSVRE